MRRELYMNCSVVERERHYVNARPFEQEQEEKEIACV